MNYFDALCEQCGDPIRVASGSRQLCGPCYHRYQHQAQGQSNCPTSFKPVTRNAAERTLDKDYQWGIPETRLSPEQIEALSTWRNDYVKQSGSLIGE